MKLLVVAVGQRVPDWAQTAWDDYAKRFPPELRVELRAVKTEPRASRTVETLMAAERERIESAVPKGARLVALDERGRVKTDARFATNVANIWAIGDCALVKNALTDQFSPPTAQFAVAQAQQLAANLLARIAGRPTRAFAYRSRGMMATTGHMKGVAQIFGLRLAGFPAWLLWRAYYLLRMPTLGRKLRIWVEWTWGMFFAADITHLRFTRTGDQDADSPVPPLRAPAPR